MIAFSEEYPRSYKFTPSYEWITRTIMGKKMLANEKLVNTNNSTIVNFSQSSNRNLFYVISKLTAILAEVWRARHSTSTKNHD